MINLNTEAEQDLWARTYAASVQGARGLLGIDRSFSQGIHRTAEQDANMAVMNYRKMGGSCGGARSAE